MKEGSEEVSSDIRYDATTNWMYLVKNYIDLTYKVRQAEIRCAIAKQTNTEYKYAKRDFKWAVIELFIEIRPKLRKFKDASQKTFSDLEELDAYRKNPEKDIKYEKLVGFADRLLLFMDTMGIKRIERKKASEENAMVS